MKKGPQFIWLNWSHAINVKSLEEQNELGFEGTIQVYKFLEGGIQHTRKVLKTEGEVKWVIEDSISDNKNLDVFQRWNIHPNFLDNYIIEAVDEKGKTITYIVEDSWFSSSYGVKEKAQQIVFKFQGTTIKTVITQK